MREPAQLAFPFYTLYPVPTDVEPVVEPIDSTLAVAAQNCRYGTRRRSIGTGL